MAPNHARTHPTAPVPLAALSSAERSLVLALIAAARRAKEIAESDRRPA
jgi:hypothetical protein